MSGFGLVNNRLGLGVVIHNLNVLVAQIQSAEAFLVVKVVPRRVLVHEPLVRVLHCLNKGRRSGGRPLFREMHTIFESVNCKAIFIILVWIQVSRLWHVDIIGTPIIVEDGHKFVFLLLCQVLDELRNHFIISTDTPLRSFSSYS